MLLASGQAPGRIGLALVAAASIFAGAWCSINFWRCRQAHCLITGVGWTVLGTLGLIGTALGRSVIGQAQQPAFLAVLALAILFEATVRRNHRSRRSVKPT